MPDRVKEKLVELLKSAYGTSFNAPYFREHELEPLADHLIAHGVTVQEGKPIEAFLHPIDTYKGLKAKYLVFKADTGGKVDNCFVLRPDKDPVAVEALRAYARNTDNETLAENIYKWVGKVERVQDWISVKDRLPEKEGRYLCVKQIGKSGAVYVQVMNGDSYGFSLEHIYHDDVTHWMPLPQPPKGE